MEEGARSFLTHIREGADLRKSVPFRAERRCPSVSVFFCPGRRFGSTSQDKAFVPETGEDFVLVCDGRYRKTDDPKVKRRKHLVFVAKAEADIGADDKAIAAALRQYSSSEE